MDLDVMENEGEVNLYVYDMTKGLARSLSPMVLGRQIDGIWHTGIVVYGREYFFSGAGIESCGPGGTMLGQPDKILKLGITEVPYNLLLEYVFGLGESTYRPGSYDLFNHNCNNFSNEMAQFLTGRHIPDYILGLPQDVLSTPLGESLRPLLESLSLRAEGSRGVSFGARAEQAAEQLQQQQEAALEEDLLKRQTQGGPEDVTDRRFVPRPRPEGAASMEDSQNGPEGVADGEPSRERSGSGEEELALPKRQKKPREPVLVFPDVNAAQAFEAVNTHIIGLLGEEERQLLTELSDFVLADTGAWALGAQHIQLIGNILQDQSAPKEGKIGLLRFLQAATLLDDIILLLHMDRKDHVLMNYVNDFEKMEPDIQEEVAKFMCNMCQPATASDWMLYISEWQQAGQPCSNNKVTIRVTVNSLLSDKPLMQEIGVRLMYNIGQKEVFDDTATELSSAILQHLHSDLTEEHAFCLLTALLRFMSTSYNDVPALIKMLGPDLNKFRGKSERVTDLVEQIQLKLSVSIHD